MHEHSRGERPRVRPRRSIAPSADPDSPGGPGAAGRSHPAPYEAREFARRAVVELPALARFAATLTRCRADAEDLVQDTVLLAMRGRAGFRPGTNLKSWMFTIMRRARGARARREAAADRAAAPPPGTRAGPQEVALMLDDANRALEALAPEQRLALLLTAVDEMSVEQAAARLGVEEGTVKSRVSRARARVARLCASGDLPPRGSSPDHLGGHLETGRAARPASGLAPDPVLGRIPF